MFIWYLYDNMTKKIYFYYKFDVKLLCFYTTTQLSKKSSNLSCSYNALVLNGAQQYISMHLLEWTYFMNPLIRL